jgi:hypothetical protein
VQTRITVPASLRNTLERSHIMRKTPLGCGKRYGGSSRISGMRRPLTTVRPSTPAAISAIKTENTYIAAISKPCTGIQPNTAIGGKSAPMINV